VLRSVGVGVASGLGPGGTVFGLVGVGLGPGAGVGLGLGGVGEGPELLFI
jgi:hypothetical protein